MTNNSYRQHNSIECFANSCSWQILYLILILPLCLYELTQVAHAAGIVQKESTKPTTEHNGKKQKNTSNIHGGEREKGIGDITSDSEELEWKKAASSDKYLILYSPKRLTHLSRNV